MARARVLLLDDDPTVRLYVGLALADLPVELVECARVDEAMAALHTAPCRLVLTDLVLRDGSGFDLLRLLRQQPALRAGAHVAVFSAAVSPEVQAQLQPFEVWRVLSKPAAIAVLRACVQEALQDAPVPPTTEVAKAAHPPSPDDDQAAALQRHFAGDLRLFEDFRSSCEAQFDDDLRRIEEAFARGDADSVHRVCHSLKTVLLMLGRPTLAAQARALDTAARAVDRELMQALWPAFRSAMLACRQPGADRPSTTGASEVGGAR